MPTATAFDTLGAFPTCPAAETDTQADYVGSLSLADAMSFFWNLYDIQLTTAGTSTVSGHTADAGGTFQFSSPNTSGSWNNLDTWTLSDCAMFAGTSTMPPTLRQPRERVCTAGSLYVLLISNATGSGSVWKIQTVQWWMRVRVDPVDSSKYAIYYKFVILAGDYNTARVGFCNPSRGSQSTSGSYVTGNMTINGLTFPWRCYYNTSISGASLSASSTAWTY